MRNEDNVKVIIRCRPSQGREKVIVRGHSSISLSSSIASLSNVGNREFTFDAVYKHITQEDLFRKEVHPLIDNIFKGYNVTILAYGQTGSGKTFTIGTNPVFERNENAGFIQRAVERMISMINQHEDPDTYLIVKVSYLELYQEFIRDLLIDNSAHMPYELPIRENRNGIITVPGLTEVEVTTTAEILELLEKGSSQRTTADTNMNAHSSRSHAIFSLVVEQWAKTSPMPESSVPCDPYRRFSSKLNFVDLAGSERLKRTGAKGIRLQESVKINSGLLALGNVIVALGSEAWQKRILRSKSIPTSEEGNMLSQKDTVDQEEVSSEIIKNNPALQMSSSHSRSSSLPIIPPQNAIQDDVIEDAITPNITNSMPHLHIPYRDSKLTRLLQDALGGDSKTLMVACVSPDEEDADETLNTLKYANRAKNIKNKPVVQIDKEAAKIALFQSKIKELEEKLRQYEKERNELLSVPTRKLDHGNFPATDPTMESNDDSEKSERISFEFYQKKIHSEVGESPIKGELGQSATKKVDINSSKIKEPLDPIDYHLPDSKHLHSSHSSRCNSPFSSISSIPVQSLIEQLKLRTIRGTNAAKECSRLQKQNQELRAKLDKSLMQLKNFEMNQGSLDYIFLLKVVQRFVDEGKIEEEFDALTPEEKAHLMNLLSNESKHVRNSPDQKNMNTSERLRTNTFPLDESSLKENQSKILMNTLQEQAKSLQETHKRLSEMTEEKVRLTDVLDDRTLRLKHLERINKKLAKKLKKDTPLMEIKSATPISKIREKEEILAASNKNIQQHSQIYENYDANLNSIKKEYEKKLELAKEEIDNMQNQYNQLQNEMNKMKVEIIEKDAMTTQTQESEKQQMNELLVSYQNKMEGLEVIVNHLKVKASEVDCLKQDVVLKSKYISELQAEINALKEQLSYEKGVKVNEIETSQLNQIKALKRQYEESKKHIKLLEEVQEIQQSKFQQQLDHNHILESELGILKEKLQKSEEAIKTTHQNDVPNQGQSQVATEKLEFAQYKNEVKELKNKLRLVASTNTKLVETLAAEKSKHERLRNAVRKKRTEKQQLKTEESETSYSSTAHTMTEKEAFLSKISV